MIRQIQCRSCGEIWKAHPLDVAAGLKTRKVYLSPKTPNGHGYSINGVFHPLQHVHCDLCNSVISGQIAVATTTWNTNREGEPGPWELEYGTVLPEQTVSVHDTLSGGKEGGAS